VLPSLAIRPRPWHPSYRVRILSLLIIAGLPVVLLALYGLGRYVQESGADIAAERVAMAQSAALTADSFAGDLRASARTLALDDAITDPTRREQLPDLLETLLGANTNWQQVAVFAADGRPLAVAGSGAVSRDESQQDYFRRVMVTQQPAFGLDLSGNGRRTLVLGVPVTFSDGGLGVIRVVPSLQRLGSELQAQAHGGSRQIILLDGQGGVLLPSPAAVAPLDPGVTQAVLAGETGSMRIGNESLLAYAPVADTGWGVVVSEPAAEAFAPAQRQAEAAILALVVTLVIAGLIGWLLGGRLADLYQQAVSARAEAEGAAELRDSVLASVSHDLRSPLAAIRGQAELQRRVLDRDGAPDPQQLLRGATRIEEAATRMNGMIAELVDAARVQAGRALELHRQVTDLVDLVQRMLAEQAHTTARHDLVFESAEPRLIAIVDRVRLERVVANLVSNAIKYSPNGGEVRVRLGCAHGWVVLMVQDHGVGIPAADLPRVFEQFHRAANVAGRFRGTGLGLAGARHIVEQHGGTISLESQEGVGTIVTVRLPLN
jgi:signal transduction histidine kinase